MGLGSRDVTSRIKSKCPNRGFSQILGKEGDDESTTEIVVTGLNSNKTHIILLVKEESLALGRKLNFRVGGKEGE